MKKTDADAFRSLQEAYLTGIEEVEIASPYQPKLRKLPDNFITLYSINHAICPDTLMVYKMTGSTQPVIHKDSGTDIRSFFVEDPTTSPLMHLMNSDDSKKVEMAMLKYNERMSESDDVNEDLLQKPEEHDMIDVTVEPVDAIAEEEVEEEKELINDEIELDEGRMKELHMYIDKGMSAEQIAKKMKLDVKTIKALMPKEAHCGTGRKDEEVTEAKGGKRIANKKMKIKNVGDLKHFIVRNYSITGKDKKDPDELKASDDVMQAPSWNAVKGILQKNFFDKREMDRLYDELISFQLDSANNFFLNEILVGGKKLTSKEIVKKIKKNKNKMPTLKAFGPIFAKFSPTELHSRDDLEGMLPDYVAGQEINALFAEDVDAFLEDGHQDISSVKTQIEIAMSALTKMGVAIDELPEDADLPTWWTNKVAIAISKLDGMADYIDAKNVLSAMDDENDVLDLGENASMSSINDLVQDIKSKTVVYADVTQGSNQGHKFYLKGKPEIKAGDILLRMDGDKSQFIHIKIDQIKDIRATKSMAGKSKAVSINLKK